MCNYSRLDADASLHAACIRVREDSAGGHIGGRRGDQILHDDALESSGRKLGKVQLEEAVVQEVQEAPQPEPEPESESEPGAEPPEGPKIEGLESEGMEPEEQEGEDTEATEDTIAEKKRRRRKPRQKEKVLRLLSDYGIGQLDERAELPGIETLLAMVPQHAAVQELREKRHLVYLGSDEP